MTYTYIGLNTSIALFLCLCLLQFTLVANKTFDIG